MIGMRHCAPVLTRAVPETSIAQIGRSFHGFCDRAMAGSSRLYCRRPRDGGVGLHDTIAGYVSPTRLQPGPKLFDADPLRADPRRMTFAGPSQQEERPCRSKPTLL